MVESGLTTIQAVLIFGGIPTAIYALIALPFLIPKWRRQARARRGAVSQTSENQETSKGPAPTDEPSDPRPEPDADTGHEDDR